VRALHTGPLNLTTRCEQWPLVRPFHIAGHTFEVLETLWLELEQRGCAGNAEAAGVYYQDVFPRTMIAQIEAIRPEIEGGLTLRRVQELLPAGGARNALDCALWDLLAKVLKRPVWQLAELCAPKPLLTTFACGAETPEAMARAAEGYVEARAIKLKLTGEPIDADRVRAVREARPDVWLGVDGNQGFTRAALEKLMPELVAARVALIEQPFPVGEESLLQTLDCPIDIAADESVQGVDDLASLGDKFDVVNIKLDKCGGLTEALLMAEQAKRRGLEAMIGNMIGTSLAMAPAYLVGQLCTVVDLDGPIFLREDRAQHGFYKNGFLHCPESVWGAADSASEPESD